jgi:hypothetical protein
MVRGLAREGADGQPSGVQAPRSTITGFDFALVRVASTAVARGRAACQKGTSASFGPLLSYLCIVVYALEP